MRAARVTFAAVAAWMCGCGLTPTKEAHPEDVEKPAPSAADGSCDGVPVVAAASLFGGPYQLVDEGARPAEGSRVAFEGAPQGIAMCSQKGCAFECCDNACGAATDCPYALTVGKYNRVCLSNAAFTCGGTDCSGYCTPFSTRAQSSYRFVGTVRYPKGTLGGAVLEVTGYCKL
ncbi:MAG: hypothetical protein KC657_24215 [Myxococcales bacterium]|nr:hypothetical protein [Myxococcales bacterium]